MRLPRCSLTRDVVDPTVSSDWIKYADLEATRRDRELSPSTMPRINGTDKPAEPAVFAVRGKGAGQLRTWERATNLYQEELGDEYRRWSQRLARDLEEAEDDDERDEIVAAALAALAVILRRLGRESIPAGMTLGLGGRAPSPALLRDIAAQVDSNELYIEGSLIPDLQTRLGMALRDPEVIATGAAAFAGILAALDARVQRYAGGMWAGIQSGVGDVSRQAAEAGEAAGIRWVLDETVEKHCPDCPELAGEYESWDAMMAETGGRMPGAGVQCDGNCRCWLEVPDGEGGWVRP